jgi:hypothetical protein
MTFKNSSARSNWPPSHAPRRSAAASSVFGIRRHGAGSPHGQTPPTDGSDVSLTVFSMQEQRIMSSERNDEQANSQLDKTRKRFKVTVVCLGLVMAVVAYATRVYLGDSRLTAIQTANLTYLAILLPGVLLDLIIFRCKPKNTAETTPSRVSSPQRTIQAHDGPN